MQVVKKTQSLARSALVCLLIAMSPAMLRAEQQFPFPAQVVEDVALVRAGVGTTYYVVKKLKKGDLVTVDEKIYQWYRIVPPQGVYSYVSKAFVDAKGDGKVGVVNKTPCEVFTASINGVADSFRCTNKLLKGDTVNIVDEDGGYYKIMPPKGAYVYIPESAVKEAEFKPAAPAPEVTPEVAPEVTPEVVPVVTPQPKPVAPEAVTVPEPEKTVMTVSPVVVAPTPQPVAPVAVVTPAPQVKPTPVVMHSPPATPVEVGGEALRPLVINKPLPGDSMPAAAPKPQPVIETVMPSKPSISSLPSTRGRATPPIPDTETPPDFEGLPSHSVASVQAQVNATDTSLPSTTQELVVDTPANTDRLDGPVPAKPDMPVVAEVTQIESVAAVPAFPVQTIDMSSSSQATQTATQTRSDPVSLPSVPAPRPLVVAPAPTVTPQPVVAPKPEPKPTVNPLLASRVHFQPTTTSLADLEQRMIDAHQLPLAQRPLADLLAAYQTFTADAKLPIHDQRIVQARIVQLKRDMSLASALNQISNVQDSVSTQITNAQPFTPTPPAPSTPRFDVVGQLLASAVYDGQNLPRLYRLVNPADTRVTLAYVRPNDQVVPMSHLGRVVGIVGKPQIDDALHLQIIDPKQVQLYQAAQ